MDAQVGADQRAWTFARGLFVALWFFWLLRGVDALLGVARTLATHFTIGGSLATLGGDTFTQSTIFLRLLLFAVAAAGASLALRQDPRARWAGMAMVGTTVATAVLLLTTRPSMWEQMGGLPAVTFLLLIVMAVPLALPVATKALSSSSDAVPQTTRPAWLAVLSGLVLVHLAIGAWSIATRTGNRLASPSSSSETTWITLEWVELAVGLMLAVVVLLLVWRTASLGWAAAAAWFAKLAIDGAVNLWATAAIVQEHGRAGLPDWLFVFPLLFSLGATGAVLVFLPFVRVALGVVGTWPPNDAPTGAEVPVAVAPDIDPPRGSEPFRLEDRERYRR